MEEIGPLKRYRLEQGMPLDTMADKLGVHKSTLGRIDRRMQWPSSDFFERLRDLTKGALTPNDFVAPIDPAPTSPAAEPLSVVS